MSTRTARPFDDEVRRNQGYRYTTNARKSSVIANRRLTDITRTMVELRGRRVVGVGCGDGTYTCELFETTQPALMVGVDAAAEAVELASRRRAPSERLRFEHHDVYALPYESKTFDVAVVRGLLHHLEDAPRGLAAIGRIAATVLLIEPNGYNPLLKAIERLSAYHRTHGERSYAPFLLRRWIRELGGRIEESRYAGLVPFFCPDWMAVSLKKIEPVVERLPIVSRLGCAVVAIRYRT